MELMRDGVLAFLAAVGLTSLIWMAAGLYFRSGRACMPGLLLVLPLKGEAPTLEADLRLLRQLRERHPGARIVLADCGLDQDTRQLAQYLADREEGTALVNSGDPIIT